MLDPLRYVYDYVVWCVAKAQYQSLKGYAVVKAPPTRFSIDSDTPQIELEPDPWSSAGTLWAKINF